MDDARRAALRNVSTGDYSCKTITHLPDSICNLVLLADIPRIEGSIVVPLHNVEYRDRVSALLQLENDVTADEAAAADNQVCVPASHDSQKQVASGSTGGTGGAC